MDSLYEASLKVIFLSSPSPSIIIFTASPPETPGFIPGVRPGKKTSEFIDNILSKVTLPGSVALAMVAIFPYILMQTMDVEYDLASFFGGTSLLIIVGVALDTLQQLESHLMMRHYDGFLTKGKIRGRRRM